MFILEKLQLGICSGRSLTNVNANCAYCVTEIEIRYPVLEPIIEGMHLGHISKYFLVLDMKKLRSMYVKKSITEALQLVLEPAPKSVANGGDQAVYNGAEYGKAMDSNGVLVPALVRVFI